MTQPDTWQSLGSAALRVVAQAERQRLAEKIFGPVPSVDEIAALYAKPTAKEDAA